VDCIEYDDCENNGVSTDHSENHTYDRNNPFQNDNMLRDNVNNNSCTYNNASDSGDVNNKNLNVYNNVHNSELSESIHVNNVPNENFIDVNKVTNSDSDPYKVLQDFKSGIIIGQLNICSVTQNFDELRHILTLNSFDVLGLCETFLTDDVVDDNVNVDNYCLYRKDRPQKNNIIIRRGGVAFYVNNQCKHVLRDDLSSEKLELLTIELMPLKRKPTIVVLWYRVPGSSIDLFNHLQHLLQVIESEGKDYMGYFTLSVHFESHKGSEFKLVHFKQTNFF
jgi:hypothetical protein